MALHREDVVCELVLEGPLEHAQPGSNTQGGAAGAKSHQGGKQGSVWEMSRGQVRLENRGLRRVKGQMERSRVGASWAKLTLSGGWRWRAQPSEQQCVQVSALAQGSKEGWADRPRRGGPGWRDRNPGT